MADLQTSDECAVVGFGVAGATLEEIARLRRDPGPGRPQALEFPILKHADEHTVLALAAMLDALSKFPAGDFSQWAVVAAPRWPGRLGTATAIDRYRADGSRGVSPMAIPNVCLHSISATVSLAFGMRGPNFGIGGGLASISDGLLAALGVQLEHRPAGTWVIFSEWQTEPGQQGIETVPRIQALALALGSVSDAPDAERLCLRRTTRVPMENVRLATLIDVLTTGSHESWECLLDWGMELALIPGTRAA